jgi:hypothetical protein
MDTASTYECPAHKLEQTGTKRDTFQMEFYDLLLKVSMADSMRLYKEINVACHCQSNYKKFDEIAKSLT